MIVLYQIDTMSQCERIRTGEGDIPRARDQKLNFAPFAGAPSLTESAGRAEISGAKLSIAASGAEKRKIIQSSGKKFESGFY